MKAGQSAYRGNSRNITKHKEHGPDIGRAHKLDKSGTAVLIEDEDDSVGMSRSKPLLVHPFRSSEVEVRHQSMD